MYRVPWTYLLLLLLLFFFGQTLLLQKFEKPICCLVSLITKMDTLMEVKKMKTQDEIETEEEEEEERIILTDIAFNILKRLPLNTVMLSRCVCKSWNSITYDLSFADEFLIHSRVRSNITSVLIFVDNFYRDRFLFYSLDHETQLARPIYHLNQPDFSSAKFTGSVNGLVCFEIGVWTYICNLTNGGMILLPFTKPDFEFRSDAKIRSYSSLGYNLVSRNYKVLKTWEISTPDSLAFVTRHKVLTLGTSVWKTVDSDPVNSEFIEFDWGNSVCVNGAIHFFSFDLIGKMKIMAFVLAKESFNMLSIPDGFSSHDQKAKLVVYKDRLAVIDYGRLEVNSFIKLYILDDYKNQVWKEENIILPHPCRYAGEHHGWSLVGSNRKGEILLAPKIAIRDFSFVSYDLEKKHLQKINVRGLPESVFWSPLMVASAPIDYVESVLSLKELYP